MKTDRLFGILSVLANSDQVTVKELADRFEVSRRTIYRDLNTLACAGIPILSTTGFGGGISVVEGYRPDRGILSHQDTEKIFTALNGLKSIGGDASIPGLIAKLVPEKPDDMFSKSPYMIDLSSWFSDSLTQKKADLLGKAVCAHRCVRLDYISKNDRSIRVVEPHKLVFKQSDWYLYAFCHNKESFRLFRLRRIASLETLGETFTPRPVTSIPFEHGYGDGLYSSGPKGQTWEVVLEYDAADEFSLTAFIDASLFRRDPSVPGSRGQIRYTVSDLRTAEQQILPLLGRVQVISPPELVYRLREHLKEIKFAEEG